MPEDLKPVLEHVANLTVINAGIEVCSRCRSQHPDLHFRKVAISSEGWTHWTLCPKLHEPILLQVIGAASQTLVIK
jgi:hypothetical protein